MQRARLSFIRSPNTWMAALVGLVATGCAEGNATSTTGPDLGASSSGEADDSEASSTSTTATSIGTGDGSSTGSADDASTSTTDAPGDTSTGQCPAGTEGCPCAAGACDDDLFCLDDVCQAAQCDGDLLEPNDDEATATDLGMVDDSDEGGIVSASLHHPGDVDWYRYQGDDDITGNVDPAREIVASAGLRLCKFLECDNGLAQTEFECPAGTQYALSPSARPGCCASDGIALPDLNCTGVTEDNAMVYIRVDMPQEACVTYSVSYHY
ncbi:hypothetical protein [Paraliomyxa miuraensis]|uniref:hypothetical protein n=1 Tax=Paraliomyxa miuraensis TaxID=376150 RepID=UPI00225B6BB2|nr:hypothetical protein [Paraliomyxa miuraensis]MCX4240743.1 hypothetical protein [Paraliomyxa miuraensis]